METQRLLFDRDQARELLQKYRAHKSYSTPIDQEIVRICKMVEKGRVIVKAIESVVAAGLGADNLPKLALCRAHGLRCYLDLMSNGRGTMTHLESPASTNQRDVTHFAEGSFAVPQQSPRLNRWGHRTWPARAEAIVPIVPIHLRPKRGLQNYHILFEAEWSRIPPKDPYLLRRIGTKGDLWLVVAIWDLTEIERAVLGSRMSS